ncbi:uncharacterized protein A1O9_06708 [Exophiala aquamarina CBS 119918]|uniref:Alpha/beta hydrolase fold-3 domain-containing protein n=1 Tax=Exophiala aquamarina CBS 119918 TaxID=1182545 RepID=A0A072P9H4_9EURO|nr:uncharacterized protein A1O9_06708 [Exophiala aquamarina CBS 119918]KEF56521.1 hypothetical protein A1O9_06708 [Exophiala aquamarina CBS 119918]
MANTDEAQFEIDPELKAVRNNHSINEGDAFIDGNQRFTKSAFVRESLGDNVAERCEEEDGHVVVRDGLETEEFIYRLLVTKLNIIIISIAYRLAPEFLYPTEINDIYDAIKWAAVSASTVGGDLSKGFLTGGVSRCGNYTDIATILARVDGLEPALTGHLYIWTGIPHRFEGENGNAIDLFPDQLAHGSWETYKHGPVASREVSKFYAG